MTQAEVETIRNIIERLRKPDCGCSHGPGLADRLAALNPRGDDTTPAMRIEAVSRVYIDTWLVVALECLLPESRDTKLAVRLSR